MLKALALCTALALSAAPALAQEAPPSPSAESPDRAEALASLAPEAQALLPQVQAAAQALEAAVTELRPRADVIRTNASLSDADKRAGIEALVSEKQPQLDAFNAALARFVTAQALSQGATEADVQAMLPMMQAEVRGQFISELMDGASQ